MPPSSRTPKTLRIAAAQMVFAPAIEGNLYKIARAAAAAKRRKADVVLFPECAVTGYSCDFRNLKPAAVREALRETGAIAARHGMNLLVGTPLFNGRKLYNCLVVFDRSGRPVHCYAKCQLTASDRKIFTPGNAVALFRIDGVAATAIICHERRYPELVRLGAMAGARIVFHPNAGLDSLAVSRKKRGGRDGIAARAFENAVYYVFANSVGPQGGGKPGPVSRWSSGDSKIVAPNEKVLALAGNESECVIAATCDLAAATGKYAKESMDHPRFLSAAWRKMVRDVRAQAKRSSDEFLEALSLE